MIPSGASHAEQRKDIQILRGVAVLLVLWYHTGPRRLPGGYLGVDVFFVISGYLVTRMVLDRIDGGRFSFREFYGRRAKRLLPASTCTLAVTTLLAVWMLSPSALHEFGLQLVGAVTFSANLVAWWQSDYFAKGAGLMPVLHFWSLSLEEQYYLLLPVFLVLLRRHWRLPGVGLALALSLGLCVYVAGVKPTAAFYALPTRAWELLLGSLCATRWRDGGARIPALLLLASLVTMVIVPALRLGPDNRLLATVVMALSTALLLIGRLRMLETAPLTGSLARVGDWSYSLYLVHWPLLSFATHAYAGSLPPRAVRLGVLAASGALAYLQYRFVESRFRAASIPARRVVLGTAGVCLVTAALAFGSSLYVQARSARASVGAPRVNPTLSRPCAAGDEFTGSPACMTSPALRVAVWGDSLAAHLVPGLRSSGLGDSLVEMTRGNCPPLLDVTPSTTDRSRPQSTSCLRFNRRVYEYLAAKPSIEFVVMSSMVPGGKTFLRADDVVTRGDRVGLDAYAATIGALRALGKKVVIVAPLPGGDWFFDVELCLERLDSGKIVFGRPSCDIEETEYLEMRADDISFLRRLERAADVTVLWPSRVLCSAGACRTAIGREHLYRDPWHLSAQGSVEFQKLFALDAEIVRWAR
jgi:peptidoglycan/LPS O-acetylase OafA/YrhL